MGPRAGVDGGNSPSHRDSIPERKGSSQPLYQLIYLAQRRICMYVRMFVCMDECVCCMYIYIYIYIYIYFFFYTYIFIPLTEIFHLTINTRRYTAFH